MKKALSLILVCLFLVSMIIPVSAAQFINAYETIQAENYSEASCASVLGLGSTHYLENCLDAGGGKNVFDWQRNTYFKYANVDFGSDAAYGFSARVADFSDHADLKIILSRNWNPAHCINREAAGLGNAVLPNYADIRCA